MKCRVTVEVMEDDGSVVNSCSLTTDKNDRFGIPTDLSIANAVVGAMKGADLCMIERILAMTFCCAVDGTEYRDTINKIVQPCLDLVRSSEIEYERLVMKRGKP